MARLRLPRPVGPEAARGLGRNLHDLPRYLTVSTVSAGVIAALPGMTGPWLLAYQAAIDAGYPANVIASWVFALFVGGGVLSLLLAILYREPICGAYPIAGSALLVPVLAEFSLPEAVGAYLLAGVLVFLIGVTGLFGWMMERIPNAVIMGMLGGILLRFGIRIFEALPPQPLLAGAMLVLFLVSTRFLPRLPALVPALVGGVIVAALTGQFDPGSVRLSLSTPVLIAPEFSLGAFFSLAVPLTLLAIATQNAPGIGILWANGYQPPVNAITIYSGIGSLLTAPIGGHGLNIAAPMTAICAAPDVHPELRGRYVATVVNGFAFIAFGLVGATAVSLIGALPAAFVAIVAGLALFPVLLQSFRLALAEPSQAVAAGFALLIAASNLSIAGINSTFWAVVAGIAIERFLRPAASGA